MKVTCGTVKHSTQLDGFHNPLLGAGLEKQRELYFRKQRTAIINQLKFAQRNVPFFEAALGKMDADNIETYKNFCESIPIVSSKQVIKNPRLFRSKLPIAFVRDSSSTTGKPKKTFLTGDDLKHWATVGRLTKTPYYKRGMVVAHSRRKERFYLSCLDESIKETRGRLITFDPKNKYELLECARKANMIMDYAEMIYYISKQLSSMSGINLNRELIVSYTGNELHEDDIEEIKKNFHSVGINITVYNEYAASEIGPIGYAVENEPFKIIYSDNVFVEVVDAKNGLPAEKGEIVVTALNRTGSVFIRYKLGDIGEIFFRREIPYFRLRSRKCGLKVASVFFPPQYIFSIVRSMLKRPIFCYITLRKGKTSHVKIRIVAEEELSAVLLKKVEQELINKMHFDGDIGSTVNIEILSECRKFGEKELTKGFRFSEEDAEIS